MRCLWSSAFNIGEPWENANRYHFNADIDRRSNFTSHMDRMHDLLGHIKGLHASFCQHQTSSLASFTSYAPVDDVEAAAAAAAAAVWWWRSSSTLISSTTTRAVSGGTSCRHSSYHYFQIREAASSCLSGPSTTSSAHCDGRKDL